MEETNALTFSSTEDLLKELHKRHDALIVSGVKFTNVNGEYVLTRFFRGHHIVCLGLLNNMSSVVNKAENKRLEEF